MAVLQYVWQVAAATATVIAADVPVSPLDRVVSLGANAHLGYGLIRPFQRDQKNDFANAGAEALVRSAVGQILGMRGSNARIVGELRWDTDRGSLVEVLRHMNNDDGLQELGRLYVAEALQRWEPRVLLSRVDVTRKEAVAGGGENVLVIELVYDIIKANVPGNNVLIPDVSQVLQITV